jgi:transcriptional regulator with XRE-family HTH domain
MKKTKQTYLHGIAAIRRDLGYSQAKLARLLDVPRSSLSMAEAGVRNIPTVSLLKLAEMEKERLAQQVPAIQVIPANSATPMVYEVSKLSKATCEVLLEKFKMERAQLDFKGATLSYRYDQAVSMSIELEAQLLDNQMELAALNEVVKELPPGSNQQDVKRNIARLEHRKLQLDQRYRRYDPAIQFEQVYDLACVKAALREVDLLLPQLSNQAAAATAELHIV